MTEQFQIHLLQAQIENLQARVAALEASRAELYAILRALEERSTCVPASPPLPASSRRKRSA